MISKNSVDLREVERLFNLLSSQPKTKWEGFLDRECPNPKVRREVLSLLEHHEAPLPLLQEHNLQRASMRGSDSLIGLRVGSFVIEEKLAQGGMGTVYRGRRDDGAYDQHVAIKIVHGWLSSPSAHRRFEHEWRTLAQLSHPHIAHLLDAGITQDGVPFLVMEFIDGKPIDSFADDRRMEIIDRLRLFQKICLAVHAAHQQLVVHRDLKPSNILVTEDGLPKLLDFGIAKPLGPAEGAPSRTHTRMLTPDYASPEQIRGESVSTQTDIYSLGVILYGLLTGKLPHDPQSSQAEGIERVVCERTPRRPSTAVRKRTDAPGQETTSELISLNRATTPQRLRRKLRGDLDNIVMTALRKEPERRYSSALQFSEDIERYLQGMPVIARRDTVWYRSVKFIQRNRVGVVAGIIILMALGGGIIATRQQAKRAEAEASAAREAQQVASAQAAHARIEALSSDEVARMLIDAFLVGRGDRPDTASAETLLDRQVFRIHRQYKDRPHVQANLLDALGRVYSHLDHFDRAEELIREALTIRRDTFGKDSLELALSLNSMGDLELKRGRYVEAEKAFREALRLHRLRPDSVHTDVAKAANNLAVALRALGKTEDSEALHREALSLRTEGRDLEPLLVAESLNNLASIALQEAEYGDSLRLLTQVRELRQSVLSEDHPLIAQVVSNMAVTYHASGDLLSAENDYRTSLDLYRQLSSGESELARTLRSFSELLITKGDLASARDCLEEALEIQLARLDEEHPDIASLYSSLASLEHLAGDEALAEEHWESCLDIQRSLYTDGHVSLATFLTSYGAFLFDIGDYERAELALREATDMYEGCLDGDHWFLAVAQVSLASTLLELGNTQEAKPMASRALETLIQERGPDSSEVVRAKQLLSRIR